MLGTVVERGWIEKGVVKRGEGVIRVLQKIFQVLLDVLLLTYHGSI